MEINQNHRHGETPTTSMALPPPDHDGITEAEQMFAKRGCCCFFVPIFSSSSSNITTTTTRRWWQRTGTTLGTPWWKRSLRVFVKVREWSELVAGPRWKTFTRRFSRRGVGGGGFGRENKRFQYDPLSYALNFDEGQNCDSDGEIVHRTFSATYLVPPVSAKSSIDFGGKDSPPLFTVTG